MARSNDLKRVGFEKILTDEPLCIYKSMNRTWNGSCELNHISVK
jgi:hypothetical protein